MPKSTSRSQFNPDQNNMPLFGLAYDAVLPHESGEHKHVKGQLLYAVEGCMHVYLANKYFIIPPMRAVWIPSSLPHACTSSQVIKYRSLYFDCKLFSELPRQMNVIHVTPLLKALILRACEFEEPYQKNSPEYHIATVIVDEIINATIVPFFVTLPKDKRLIKLLHYLEKNSADKNSIETLATQFGFSSRTLTRLCKKEFGLSFDQWRMQLKLAIALELLANNHSTSYVAQTLGYSNDSAFIAMFKRMTGEVPSAYRPTERCNTREKLRFFRRKRTLMASGLSI